jgi:hypothetical protein
MPQTHKQYIMKGKFYYMQNLPVFQQQQQWLNKLYIEPIMEEGINGWIGICQRMVLEFSHR